jgi:hypothetical protein
MIPASVLLGAEEVRTDAFKWEEAALIVAE